MNVHPACEACRKPAEVNFAPQRRFGHGGTRDWLAKVVVTRYTNIWRAATAHLRPHKAATGAEACKEQGSALKDDPAFAAVAIWFALNFALWIVVPSVISLSASSVVLGVLFFAGFFGYLAYRNHCNSHRSKNRSILTIVIFSCWPMCAAASDLTGTASVIDGDTIEIDGQPILLFGIDAPETRQTCEAGGQVYPCGRQAALALADRIGQQAVACELRDTDRYGLIVAVCRADGEDLNAWLVRLHPIRPHPTRREFFVLQRKAARTISEHSNVST